VKGCGWRMGYCTVICQQWMANIVQVILVIHDSGNRVLSRLSNGIPLFAVHLIFLKKLATNLWYP
jgi:hypothetical protein